MSKNNSTIKNVIEAHIKDVFSDDKKLADKIISSLDISLLTSEFEKLYTPSKTTEKKMRKKKDKESPKNPLNAYMFYCNHKRSEVKAANPEMDAKSITKTIATTWNGLDADEKAPYVEMSTNDKVRFEKENKEYKSKKEDGGIANDEKVQKAPAKTKPAPRKPKKPVEKKAVVKPEKPVVESDSEDDDELSDE